MMLCKRCNEYLPKDYFGSDKSRISGKSIYCKACRARLAKVQRKLKPKEKSQYSRLRRYGISKERYQEMMEEQEGSCAICKTKEPSSIHQELYIDHDHLTGIVRGLLCRNCNLMLGFAKDNVSVLKGCIEYLKKYSTKG